ncbi:hypothetical protein [Azohydromonas lata]|uniref:Uncharacterized protein n=1 Tax=Azohydromonas lata TaxID=45677 RepID=A0ABU5IK65_9BURK|nr:hypothetical protein [Azohydromonas lata]MDZ5459254.1 hypothetical protein [Azohydromonas lata]
MEGLCITRSPWPPVRGHAAAFGRQLSSHGVGFEPGPYYLGASGRTLHHDNLPSPGGLVAVVPVLANAHLLKAAPDLFAVAQALAHLPAAPSTEALAVLVEAAHVAVARALGAIS